MTPLRALFCEDSPADAELLHHELVRGGYDLLSTRVETAEQMQAALDEHEWDIVFSDWSLSRFDAVAALDILHRNDLDLPFIIVSGTIGEDVAVAALRCGAHDFFAKDRLVRLVAAVERELREKLVRDERRHMQEQLMIADRMASVGILAAGVGHEINNPLSAVLGNLELALGNLEDLRLDLGGAATRNPAVASLEESLRDAHESALRIREVANDLRLFARADTEDHAAVDVVAVIESSLRMARTELRRRGRVVTDLAPVPMVLANESRLGQALLNLIVNAAQAIPEGHRDENAITVTTRRSETGQVLIDVADTGTGMPPEVLKRLFTPFFTTKDSTVGTGLGLSICQRIISSFGGTITVESEPGKGSVFRVELPPAAASGADALQTPAPAEEPAPARGSVLVIDDEPSVRTLIRRVLGGEHDVIGVSSAAEAIDMLAAGARFDLILCDLMMPQMSGMAFFETLGEVAADARPAVVFVTGGAFTEGARQFIRSIDNLVIEKPFDMRDLRRIVDERLATR